MEDTVCAALGADLSWTQVWMKRMTCGLIWCGREPCNLRVVKKEGANFGRKFYVCPRPDVCMPILIMVMLQWRLLFRASIHRRSHLKGHASNKEASCNHFEWVQSKSSRK